MKVLGNHTEFQRVASLLQDTVDFDIDVNASVFETNIRGTEGGDASDSDQSIVFMLDSRPIMFACVCVAV